jgi:hypothetical protein
VEASQRARVAMDRMVRQLRSQVCLDSQTYPIVSASDNSITFYADYDDNPVYRPEKRTLTFDPAGAGKLTEERYQSTSPTGPPWTFPATPTRTFTLLTGVGRIGSTPIFRYFNPDGAQLATPLDTATTSPLPSNSIARASLVEVAFQTLPSSGNPDTTRRADRDTRVYVRTSDTTGPVCG